MHSTLLIFLDGIGIGENNPDKNIFVKQDFKFYKEYFGQTPHLDNQKFSVNDSYFFPSDACMGVDGLPQSGTGQASIFGGFNAPKHVGFHFGPFPHSTTVPVLKEKNIFIEFKNLGLNPVFANAYPKVFFDYIRSGRKRLSVTSLSCLISDVKLKSATDLRSAKAISAEIDNKRWVDKLNYNLPIIKPSTAAKRLFKLCKNHELVVYEFFLSDHFGHGRNLDIKDHVLNTLDEFLFFILTNLPNNVSLVICSDHGNLEDNSVKTHTRNPAITITSGKNSKSLSKKIKSLKGIKPAILEMYR